MLASFYRKIQYAITHEDLGTPRIKDILIIISNNYDNFLKLLNRIQNLNLRLIKLNLTFHNLLS